jgi:hypothetical protein
MNKSIYSEINWFKLKNQNLNWNKLIFFLSVSLTLYGKCSIVYTYMHTHTLCSVFDSIHQHNCRQKSNFFSKKIFFLWALFGKKFTWNPSLPKIFPNLEGLTQIFFLIWKVFIFNAIYGKFNSRLNKNLRENSTIFPN